MPTISTGVHLVSLGLAMRSQSSRAGAWIPLSLSHLLLPLYMVLVEVRTREL